MIMDTPVKVGATSRSPLKILDSGSRYGGL
jgi:hypothetical protein